MEIQQQVIYKYVSIYIILDIFWGPAAAGVSQHQILFHSSMLTDDRDSAGLGAMMQKQVLFKPNRLEAWRMECRKFPKAAVVSF